MAADSGNKQFLTHRDSYTSPQFLTALQDSPYYQHKPPSRAHHGYPTENPHYETGSNDPSPYLRPHHGQRHRQPHADDQPSTAESSYTNCE